MRIESRPTKVEGLIRMSPYLAREIILDPYRVISYPLTADAHYEIFWASFVRNENNLDLYHFAWSIWNHFRVGKQDMIVKLLKVIFATKLSDVDVKTIKAI